MNVPDNRREPILKRKRLASVASEETAVGGGFEETEVDPGDKEAELDEYEGGGAEEDDEDVGDEEVDAGEGLKWKGWIEKVGRKKYESEARTDDADDTHLDTKLNLAQELDLVFRDKLGKRDEEADLES